MFPEPFQGGFQARALLALEPVAFQKLCLMEMPDILDGFQEELHIDVGAGAVRFRGFHQGVHQGRRAGPFDGVMGFPRVSPDGQADGGTLAGVVAQGDPAVLENLLQGVLVIVKIGHGFFRVTVGKDLGFFFYKMYKLEEFFRKGFHVFVPPGQALCRIQALQPFPDAEHFRDDEQADPSPQGHLLPVIHVVQFVDIKVFKALRPVPFCHPGVELVIAPYEAFDQEPPAMDPAQAAHDAPVPCGQGPVSDVPVGQYLPAVIMEAVFRHGGGAALLEAVQDYRPCPVPAFGRAEYPVIAGLPRAPFIVAYRVEGIACASAETIPFLGKSRKGLVRGQKLANKLDRPNPRIFLRLSDAARKPTSRPSG